MREQNTLKLNKNERGFASIVIALILIIVLSLLTLAFSQLARREQRTALSKALAYQANSAAETGINDIAQIIQTAQNSPTASLNMSTLAAVNSDVCLNKQSLAWAPNNTIDATNGVSYTCALLNVQPPSLNYSCVSPLSGQTTNFSLASGTLDHLTISWGSCDGHNDYRSAAQFTSNALPPVSQWIGTGGKPAPPVEEVSITPVNGYDRSTLNSATAVVYLYPSLSGSSSSWAYTPGSVGTMLSGNCNPSASTQQCQVNITFTPGQLPSTGIYLIHFLNFYDQANISVQGLDSSSAPLNFVNGQALIDVTGQAHNVLKRLQVRIPLNGNNSTPPFVIEGSNVCKEFSTSPGSTQVQDPTAGPPAQNPCDLAAN
jgi:hypothetical protein